MEIVEVTWGRAFKVWWSIAWRSMLFGLLASIGFGLLWGVLAQLLGLGSGGMLFGSLLGFVLGVLIAIWAVRAVLYKRYSDFSVVCIANEDTQPQAAPAVTAGE